MSRLFYPQYNLNGSGDSSVGIGTAYELDVQVLIPSSAIFSVLYKVQTSSRAHPASYLIFTLKLEYR
jgi:hypothetical protein